jgi:hypothetical protein
MLSIWGNSRWWPCAAAGAIAVAVVVAVAASSGAAPAATRGSAATGPTVLKASASLPAKAPVRRLLKPLVATSTCPTVRAQLSQYAARHIKEVVCWTTGPGATLSLDGAGTRLAAPAVTLPPPPPQCGTEVDIWVVSRFSECIYNMPAVAQRLDPQTHAVIGQVLESITQDITMSANNNTINESDQFTVVSATPTAAGPATYTWTPSCTGQCKALTGTQTFVLSPGQTKSGGIQAVYLDNPAAGQQDPLFFTSTTLTYAPAAGLPISPGGFSTPDNIRCDNGLGASGIGCVIPAVIPDLPLSVATYGAAAKNVEYGEDFIPGTPGLFTSTPLTRGDPRLTQGNSDAICDNTFKTITRVVPNDSCDEYPFASSQQSGAARNLTGADCFDIIPYNNAGTWEPVFVSELGLGLNGNEYTGHQLCERGHVPADKNQAVGGALGRFYNTQRMLAGDPYTVTVTQ